VRKSTPFIPLLYERRGRKFERRLAPPLAAHSPFNHKRITGEREEELSFRIIPE